jgi:hypothetical protein
MVCGFLLFEKLLCMAQNRKQQTVNPKHYSNSEIPQKHTLLASQQVPCCCRCFCGYYAVF